MENSELSLTKRIYCSYNAASGFTHKSETDINVMYKQTVQNYYTIITRSSQPDNIPTSGQAEILFFGTIPVEYIDSIEDI